MLFKSLYKLLLQLFIVVASCSFAKAQYSSLTGNVSNIQTLKPVVNAEVYIANTTLRAKTDTNGIYTLPKLPAGVYQLIIRCVGYETKQQEFTAITGSQTMSFTLVPRIIELPEVIVEDRSDRKQQLAKFKREFLGKADETSYEILNDQILSLKYNSDREILRAKTDDFLEIVNKKLGYKLRFLINHFWVDYKALEYHYNGSVIFEELQGTDKEQKRWNKNRDNAYDGSFRHFMVSLTSNQIKKNGFVIKRLIREANPKRPPDSLIKYKISKQFKYIPHNKRNNDSLNKWVKLSALPKIVERLEKPDVNEPEIIKPGKMSQTYDLDFNGYLYIIYKHIGISLSAYYVPAVNELQRFNEAKFYQIAAISMKIPQQPITFTDKGIQISKGQLFNEGAWSESRVLDLLPFDYIPDKN